MSLVLSIVLVVVNGVFVAFEFALLASLRSRVEVIGVDRRVAGRIGLSAMSRIGPMLAGAQLGITIASLGLGAVAEPAIAHRLEPIAADLGIPEATAHTVALVVALGLVVSTHMVIGVMVPKNIALATPEGTLLALAPAMTAFVWLFGPVIASLKFLGNLGAKALGIQPTDELSSAANAAEFEIMLGESRARGLVADEEHELLMAALAFRDRTASDVMVDRFAISALGYRSSVADFERLIRESGHSRIVVTGSGPDDLVGFLHAKDLLRLKPDHRDAAIPLTMCRPTFSVPAGRHLADVLVEMRRSARHVAWVHDDEGRVIGMVTMEDILEQIVGAIVDETDRERR